MHVVFVASRSDGLDTDDATHTEHLIDIRNTPIKLSVRVEEILHFTLAIAKFV